MENVWQQLNENGGNQNLDFSKFYFIGSTKYIRSILLCAPNLHLQICGD